MDSEGAIRWNFPQKFRAPGKDYRLAAVKTKALGDAKISIKPDNNFPEKNGYFEFTLNLDYVHFHEAPSIGVQLELTWQTIEFEIIDQWVEVVPTDQVAGVAVRYNPVTGRQIPPE